ncbi:Triosephosphate isomerase [Chlamydiales bacterium STE3]|nr:Triosephosphate isomerase [Chlamydiales bacterium STE3]
MLSIIGVTSIVKFKNRMMKKRYLIAANWKMHKTVAESIDYLKVFQSLLHSNLSNDVYLAPPFTALYPLVQHSKNLPIAIGAQNMSDKTEGALTGEISVRMLVEVGASFVILGHSERRHLFHEDNRFIQRKIQLALQNDLEVLLCIGETAEERSSGMSFQVIEKQLEECLKGVEENESKKIIIAYEPVWAIGSGNAAAASEVQVLHERIRHWCERRWKRGAAQLRILYGGSVSAKNAPSFLKEKDIDGLLVGTASLDPQTFSEIVNLS